MSLWYLFITFFKIGLFSIGGGYAIIPMIQEQVVELNAWVTPQIFTDIITISQMTPGPLAVNTSTFVGIQIAGISGAIVATVGCVLAGIVISIALYCFFQKFKKSNYVFEVLRTLKATSVGLILSASATIMLLSFCKTSDLKAIVDFDFIAVVLFTISLFLLRKYKMNPITLMILTGIAGVFIYP